MQNKKVCYIDLDNVYKEVLEKISEAAVITDFKGKILWANKIALKMFKFKHLKNGIGKFVFPYIVSGYRKKAAKDYINVLRGKEGYPAEYKVKDNRGNEIWVQGMGRKIFFQNKNAVLETLRDITKNKEIEIKIKEINKTLVERIKELNCLYELSVLIEKEDNLENIFNKIVKIIPFAFQYPEITFV